MKTTTLYDFTLTAGGAQIILADANMYKVLTATGDISVTRDGGATIKPLRAGRGERNVAFQRLILRDLSGAPNSGTILVGDSDFIDDTIVLSSAINVRPESASLSVNNTGGLSAATAYTVMLPSANTGGALILNASIGEQSSATSSINTLLAKTSAPASISDGENILTHCASYNNGTAAGGAVHLPIPQYIAAGLGLYVYSLSGMSANSIRSARIKLL